MLVLNRSRNESMLNASKRFLSPRLKNSGKYCSGLSYRWALFNAGGFVFSCILFSIALISKNRFNILFGGGHSDKMANHLVKAWFTRIEIKVAKRIFRFFSICYIG